MTFLAGYHTHAICLSFWPKVAENPNSEEWTPEQRDLSQAGRSVKTIVVSESCEAISAINKTRSKPSYPIVWIGADAKELEQSDDYGRPA